MSSDPSDAARHDRPHSDSETPQASGESARQPDEAVEQAGAEPAAESAPPVQPAAHSEPPSAGSGRPAETAAGGGASGGGEAALPPTPKRKIQIGSRHGLDRPRTLKPQVAGADKKVVIQQPAPIPAQAQATRPAAPQAPTAPQAPEVPAASAAPQPQPAPASAEAPPSGAVERAEAAETTPPSAPRQEAASGDAPRTPAAAKPPVTGQDAARPKVPKPSVRDQLSPELEAEINAALGDAALEKLMGGDEAAGIGQDLEVDSRRRATVVKVHGDNVFLSLGSQHEGVVSVRQFAEPPEVGSVLDVVVKGYQTEEGLYEVTVPGASIDVSDWSDLTEGAVVEARITGSNTGGLECMVNNIRGFIPASQIAQYRVENFAEFIDQRLQCVVTEANPQRRNLVLSHRAVLEREQEAKRQQLLSELEEGQIREGVVRNIRDFGAFVDLGGVDGLVHVSQLSWERVNHPSDVLSEGQEVRVKIEKIDPETGKIGLSIRNLEQTPWSRAATDYPVGAVVKGQVSRIAKFGAFVRIGPGVEGLIHISELAHQRVPNVSSVVNEGQEVQVKVLSVDAEAQRIALSLKATQEAPVEAGQPGAQEEEDEPPRELAVKPQRKGPLKGGTDRPSGGEQFGLKW